MINQVNKNPKPLNHICQHCATEFPSEIQLQTFMVHVKNCPQKAKKPKKGKEHPQYIFEKVATDSTNTSFKWIKSKRVMIEEVFTAAQMDQFLGDKYMELSTQQFQIKESFFRRKIQNFRISWTEGADTIKVSKNNLLVDSLNQIKNINLHKELKVEFEGEKINDAGGILREWLLLILKQIFEIQLGIFKICDVGDGIGYQLVWDQQLCEELTKQWLYLFGIVLGKAIFQRIPLNSFLARTILRTLTNKPIKIQDIYGFDQEIYKSWKFLENGSAEQIEASTLFFVYTHNKGGQIQEIELLTDGKQIKVTKQTVPIYLEACIQQIIVGKVEKSIKYIKEGIQKVFPIELLGIFEPFELEMIIYGIPYIDIEDWETNTQYKAPYKPTHQVIKWFWKVMKEFEQEQLQKILQFCTGSTKTPISGFRKLESNRGNFSKFLIVSSEFNEKHPYPKGYTCFNRLQLPLYKQQEDLKKYLTLISKCDFDGIFGLQ